jgi:threonine/homoserine/homoserine lactone efflux protein
MDLSLLFKGFVLGLAIAAPVGPIGILCIRRTLSRGRAVGLVSGLGAATADAVYGMVAGLGLTILTDRLFQAQTWMRSIGGLYLGYLGVKTFLAPPPDQEVQASGGGIAGAFVSTFALTVSNPMTALSFLAAFASSDSMTSRENVLLLVLGVFSGSALWWLTLSTGVSLLRGRFTVRTMRWVNRLAGTALVLFAAVALVGLVQMSL